MIDLQHHYVESFDGTRLRYQSVGQGPPVVLINGLGASAIAWRNQLQHLRGSCRLLSWDYRGLFGSERPASLAALRIVDHVRDLQHVLDAAGVARAVLVGWSMGVQVALELYRQLPARCAALVLINGTAGRPFRTAFNRSYLETVIPLLLTATRYNLPFARGVTRWASMSTAFLPLARRLGLIGPRFDQEVIDQVRREFAELDLEVYTEIFRRLGEHDASDVLPLVQVPTLIVAGRRDPLTPRAVAAQMAARIPHAEMVVIEDGTHYVALETPELLNHHLLRFLRHIGYVAPQTPGDTGAGSHEP